jgi:hydrogenase expression/formation protein HypE
MQDKILLNHGSGGKLMREMINDLFLSEFDNDILNAGTDSAIINIPTENIAFTTDSYVIDPIFFPGGNIGKLAVCGTVNDLAVSGAEPKYISCSLILEEGLAFDDLKKIIKSMAETAQEAGVKIVTGDTKVVNKGKCDKIFINTAGIGDLKEEQKHISFADKIAEGDYIILNGNIGEHGMAILKAREDVKLDNELNSDCAPLNGMIKVLLDAGIDLKFMRDATRGGVATVLSELATDKEIGIEIYEDKIPVSESVKGMCEVFGFDPLYIANEGKIVLVISEKDAQNAIGLLKRHKYGANSNMIGKITKQNPGKVVLETEIGGRRIIDMLAGEQLPRIC